MEKKFKNYLSEILLQNIPKLESMMIKNQQVKM